MSALIGLLGYWRGSLTRSGVLGAILTGTAIFGFGGIIWGVLLVAFFISSSLLSHHRASAKRALAEKFQKGSRRDLGQALANGGWASVLALAYGLRPSEILFVAFMGALATVTADTWATEVGVLSPRAPHLITNGKLVARGTSGGLTVLGTASSIAGGLFIGASAAVTLTLLAFWGFLIVTFLNNAPSPFAQLNTARLISLTLIGGASGLLGSLFDSLLGATVQAVYFCDLDHKETERRVHSCGCTTRRLRGWSWVDNDGVNFASSVFGSLVAIVIWLGVG